MDFAIYVLCLKRFAGLRGHKFRVAVYEVRGSVELHRMTFETASWRRRTALRLGMMWADRYTLDQTKSRRSLAVLFIPQPDAKVRVVEDPSPDARKQPPE